MFKQITTLKAPKAIGPYSQAIETEDFIFVSGQIPIDPETGKLVDSNIQEQTLQVLNNIEAILNAANLDFSHVVKVEIFVKNIQDFPIINTLYSQRMTQAIKPARQLVEVSKLPMDSLIEISCIAKK